MNNQIFKLLPEKDKRYRIIIYTVILIFALYFAGYAFGQAF